MSRLRCALSRRVSQKLSACTRLLELTLRPQVRSSKALSSNANKFKLLMKLPLEMPSSSSSTYAVTTMRSSPSRYCLQRAGACALIWRCSSGKILAT